MAAGAQPTEFKTVGGPDHRLSGASPVAAAHAAVDTHSHKLVHHVREGGWE